MLGTWSMDDQGRAILARFERDAHSFVIRMWRENHEWEDAAGEWRGWIDHVQSGERLYFRDMSQINGFLQRYLDNNTTMDDVLDLVQGGNE